jgi:release factor glutamine methyltransferase
MPCARDLLASTALPRLEARMLLEHALGRPRAWILAHDDEPLPPQQLAEFDRLVQRRAAGEPMAYLVGRREFMGHDFQVAPGVLIPRPETELLVEAALQGIAPAAAARVLDLGTGSGAIAIAIALARPCAEVTATDRSAAALRIAAANAARLGARVQLRAGDWYGALDPEPEPAAPGGPSLAPPPPTAPPTFDVIVSNPPYIPRGDPHLEQGDLRHEPPEALSDGADGLQALRAIIAGAPRYLRPGGVLWVEHGWDQAAAVRDLLQAAGLRDPASRRDLAGIERISGAYL